MEMSQIIARIYESLEQLETDCPLEEVAALCPELTWNQVFLAIDSLSRSGQIRITLDSGRIYRVQASRAMLARGACPSPSPAVPSEATG